MSYQIRDKLLINGSYYYIDVTPLCDLLRTKNIVLPEVDMHSTGLHRGYIGTWHLCDDKLFLIGLEIESHNISGNVFDDIFGLKLDRVFANWYSGEVTAIPASQDMIPMHFDLAENMVSFCFSNGRIK